ncbi:MAG: PASTA domain-containing protein [Alloprevotella sp.]|nr:PASTA domain-containing protein [Bacteroidales bacterium]MDY3803389.1 PASTA domain-containing protein [Alloprevotella sp.]MCI6070102.1 PASTA domain-containing protein [Bacteroidales bacterium]MCI7168473.1 PASTA domain-containing protein [Bacteroidales bacterium]MDD6501371.1 PASTA domain-containing protein [Bacteroidales bacterium]
MSAFIKKIFSPLVMLNCLGMILVVVLFFFGTLAFIDFYTLHGEEVEVPKLTGVSEQIAYSKLKALGLKAEVRDTGYVHKAAPFEVLEQSIKPGTKIKPGRTIYLTINSNGSKRIELPDLADNCSRREAEDKLKTLGFKLGATEFIIGDPDWVYEVKVNGKTVKAGTRISVDLPITLVVGKGGLEDEYNGNDSLDYIFNAPFETDEPLEGEVTDAPQDNAQPEEDYFGEE